MQPHHHQTVALSSILIEHNGECGKCGRVEVAEIDCVFLVAVLEVLERGEPSVPFNNKKSPLVLAFDENRVDVEPAISLDAVDQVSDVFLMSTEYEAGSASLYVDIEKVLRRDGR